MHRKLRIAGGTLLALVFAALFVCQKPNPPISGAAVIAVGLTNAGTNLAVLLKFEKVFQRAPPPPPGHKAWFRPELTVECTLADGGVTNIFWTENVGYVPDRDIIHQVRLPLSTRRARVTSAEARLGSFQDVRLPLEFPPINQRIRYQLRAGQVFAAENSTFQ